LIYLNITGGLDVDLIAGDEQDSDGTPYPGCGDKISSDDPVIAYVDQGNLYCRGVHVDGDPDLYFDMDGAILAILPFCSSAVNNNILLGGAGGQDLYEIAENDGYDHDLDISAEWGQGTNCPPPMDFSQYDAGSVCQDRLTNVIQNCMFPP